LDGRDSKNADSGGLLCSCPFISFAIQGSYKIAKKACRIDFDLAVTVATMLSTKPGVTEWFVICTGPEQRDGNDYSYPI